MPISLQQVVSLHYTLNGSDGRLLDDSRRRDMPLRYLHGHDNIVAGLERALDGREPGDRLRVELPPREAYGERDEALIQDVARSAFGENRELSPGMRFQAQGPDGPRAVTIVAVGDSRVTVDANHPLAGQTLRYELEVLDVRGATRAELAKGHPLDDGVEPSQVEDRKMP
ncbi:FKBP-type peptidyl-prolyl cis-trans isomerase [Modicisalibacter radicis]|uniref:FKBP-type peptidyl-prolyl cis-trans isomerase n=1 Tax=Halomonas sp. EAR18 TaxID=2518972 RepID=UPI00109CF685|nr:peptidylprolyl isomerase [Halomonas sp. EAR18]